MQKGQAKSVSGMIAASILALSAGMATNAGAQNIETNTYDRAVDEVVVTAQRREQNVQDVPIAISVFDSDQLSKLAFDDLDDLAARTPGFTFSAKDAQTLQLNIRGISSSDDGAGASFSVITYVDDVPISRAAGQDLDLFDLERVEVLRGPQGTLFGRNAIGGAVSLVTTKPSEELLIKAEARIGNFDRQDFRGLISGPISDNLFGKISFSSRNRDGILDSTIDDVANFESLFPSIPFSLAEDINALDIDTQSIRAGLRFVPTPSLEFNLTGSYSTLNQSGPQRVFIGDEQEFGVRGDLLVPGRRDDFHQEFFDDPGFTTIDTYSATLNAEYVFAQDYALTSITSYRSINSAVNDVISSETQARALLTVPSDIVDAGLIGPTSNPATEDVSTFTQEIRVTSPDGERLQWVAGAFYLNEQVRRNEQIVLGTLNRPGGSDNNDIISVDDVLVGVSVGTSGDDQDASINSYAVFGQVDYELFDRLTITGGIRYTNETIDISRILSADGIVVPFIDPEDAIDPDNPVQALVENSANFDEFTPKAVLTYQPTDDFLIYGSYSRGFKAGGFQGRGTSVASITPAFAPELADTYEAGIKASFFDGALQINPTLFYTDFRDLQVVFLLRPEGSPDGTTASLVTTNAADAEIFGVELEYAATPFRGFSLNGGFAYLDATFSEFFTPSGFETEDGGPLPNDLAGNRLQRTPRFAASQSVAYSWDVPSLNGAFEARGEFIYRGATFGDAINDPDVATPSYAIGNLRLTYIYGSNGNAEISGWVENITNKDYLQNNFSQDGGGRALPGAPRLYGVTFRWKFGGA